MAIARCTQGIANRQPIIFLVLEIVGSIILLSIVARSLSKSSLVFNQTRKIYEQQLKNLNAPDARLVSQFALDGI